MTNYLLNNIDHEDLGDFLLKVENSFDIKFLDDELLGLRTLGELCDIITNKIQLVESDNCTSQQAFYKLRETISTILEFDKDDIYPNTKLDRILTRNNRRTKTKMLESGLGFKLNILRPPHWIATIVVISLIISIITLFINFQIGLLLTILSGVSLWTITKFGKELDIETVGQLAEKMTRENYVKSRRDGKTFNKGEIKQVVTDFFCDYLMVDKPELKAD